MEHNNASILDAQILAPAPLKVCRCVQFVRPTVLGRATLGHRVSRDPAYRQL